MKQIPLTKGKIALVDNEDYEFISQFKWYCTAQGYACRDVRVEGKRKAILMHRLLANTPEGMYTDHINGNKLDNRKENLRVCTNAENMQNCITHSKGKGVSKYKGVTYNSRKAPLLKRWVARIYKDNKRISLGYFNTEREAALAYNEAALKYHGEYAKLNEIE